MSLHGIRALYMRGTADPALISLFEKGLTVWAVAARRNLRPYLFFVVLTTVSDAAELLRAFSFRSCGAPLVEY